jgi:aspartyl-tRNA(Asn)/glutamyl-tRNA(Gln) amidotransferase subunit B
MKYVPTIGLEVHCELKTNSKNFSSARNSYTDIPNTNVSPVDIGYPGILPVVNMEAVRKSIKMALALNCTIPEYLSFERKNYFYPDLPKGYQITQTKNPIGKNGYVMINVDGEDKKIEILDTHLEEDTASLDHYKDYSLLDYNRCGVPLLETVTGPCMHSSKEAIAFLETLRNIFLYCDISDARSDRGQIRCDVNISLSEEGSNKLGTRTEMKNINSFSLVKDAIEAEIKRQEEVLSNGGVINQETRRYDSENNTTHLLRTKEDAIDYRYFTEPNIPRIKISKELVSEIKSEIPILQYDRFMKYTKEYNINNKDANTLVRDKDLSDYYEECIKYSADKVMLSNWLTGDIIAYLNKNNMGIKELFLTPEMLVNLINMINDGKISGHQAKEVLAKSLEEKTDPVSLVKSMGMEQISDKGEIEKIVDKILLENPKLVDDYKEGKRVFDYLIGLIMKETRGKVNPKMASLILKEKLDSLNKTSV